jgi:hypothetical protein
MQCSCAVFSSVACPLYNIFPSHLINVTALKKRYWTWNVCFDFLYNIFPKHGYRVVPYGRTDRRTDGRTDMTKLTLAFRNFAKASTIHYLTASFVQNFVICKGYKASKDRIILNGAWKIYDWQEPRKILRQDNRYHDRFRTRDLSKMKCGC